MDSKKPTKKRIPRNRRRRNRRTLRNAEVATGITSHHERHDVKSSSGNSDARNEQVTAPTAERNRGNPDVQNGEKESCTSEEPGANANFSQEPQVGVQYGEKESIRNEKKSCTSEEPGANENSSKEPQVGVQNGKNDSIRENKEKRSSQEPETQAPCYQEPQAEVQIEKNLYIREEKFSTSRKPGTNAPTSQVHRTNAPGYQNSKVTDSSDREVISTSLDTQPDAYAFSIGSNVSDSDSEASTFSNNLPSSSSFYNASPQHEGVTVPNIQSQSTSEIFSSLIKRTSESQQSNFYKSHTSFLRGIFCSSQQSNEATEPENHRQGFEEREMDALTSVNYITQFSWERGQPLCVCNSCRYCPPVDQLRTMNVTVDQETELHGPTDQASEQNQEKLTQGLALDTSEQQKFETPIMPQRLEEYKFDDEEYASLLNRAYKRDIILRGKTDIFFICEHSTFNAADAHSNSDSTEEFCTPKSI